MRGTRVVAAVAVLCFVLAGQAAAHDHPDPVTGDGGAGAAARQGQHPAAAGHLPGSVRNMELVGRLDVSGAVGVHRNDHVADVAVRGNYAYLAARRLNTTPCGPGGFYVVDISNPAAPTEVGFVEFPPHTYPGEGMQVLRLNTPYFRGDVLVANNENCGTSPARVGGMSLYDVTNPLAPVPLAVGVGDTNGGALTRARQTHSVFAWEDGRRAFAIMVDNEEVADTDIMDITDPRNPVLVRETGILDWPQAHKALAHGESVFLHDLVVKKVRGDWLALLSYWDAGWIVLNVNDPANPVYVGDSDYPDPDPLLGASPPEGNAHQAEWSHNNRYILGTDEDFAPSRTRFRITSGPHAGSYGGGQFSWTVPITPSKPFAGRTVWGGSGCVEDVDGNGVSDRAEVPPAASPDDVIVFTRGTCFFSIKVESGQLAGYDKVVIGQSHGGTRNGLTPDGFTCGGQGHVFTITASAICIGHRSMHRLFDDPPEYTSTPEGSDLPARGTLGASVAADTSFDGWGGLRLLDARTLRTIDSYAIPEALDPAYATGFGTLSVHEVAMDKARDLAYVAYYAGGMRVLRFGPGGITEVGHYIAEGGSDFWGVEAHRLPGDPTETTYILGSDRDSGLWIFRYTGP